MHSYEVLQTDRPSHRSIKSNFSGRGTKSNDDLGFRNPAAASTMKPYFSA